MQETSTRTIIGMRMWAIAVLVVLMRDVSDAFVGPLSPILPRRLAVVTFPFESEVHTLYEARNKDNGVSADAAIDSLTKLERQIPTWDKETQNSTWSSSMLANLDGAWRLVFTTGTADYQKRVGKLNYFPVKAVQSFDLQQQRITNGVYVDTFPVIQFNGSLQLIPKMRKPAFDFDKMCILGLPIPLPRMQPRKEQTRPFFKWIYVDDAIACARGGGGGLAMWRRDHEMTKILIARELS